MRPRHAATGPRHARPLRVGGLKGRGFPSLVPLAPGEHSVSPALRVTWDGDFVADGERSTAASKLEFAWAGGVRAGLAYKYPKLIPVAMN